MITPDQHPNLSGKSTPWAGGSKRPPAPGGDRARVWEGSPVGEEPACEELPMRTVHQSTQPTFPAGDHHRGLNWALSYHNLGSRSQQKPQILSCVQAPALSQSCLQHLSLVMSKTWVTGLVQGSGWAPLPPPHWAPPPGSPAHLPGQRALPEWTGHAWVPEAPWQGCRHLVHLI